MKQNPIHLAARERRFDVVFALVVFLGLALASLTVACSNPQESVRSAQLDAASSPADAMGLESDAASGQPDTSHVADTEDADAADSAEPADVVADAVPPTDLGETSATPTAVLVGPNQVTPMAEVMLSGELSVAPIGRKIVKWEWKLVGSSFGPNSPQFYPNENAPTVILGRTHGTPVDITLDTVGVYPVELRVWDDQGKESVVPATHTVTVHPTAALHVELTWDLPPATKLTCNSGTNSGSQCENPADCGGSDCGYDGPIVVGPDLDLHVAHDDALLAKICTVPPEMCGAKPCGCGKDNDADGVADPWFNIFHDCFWFNQDPNWAMNPNAQTNPHQLLDDVDGWGPEIAAIQQLEKGAEYWLGVHVWQAAQFGPSTARLKVWLHGKPVLDVTSQPLKGCDMWWVKRVAGSLGQLIDIGGPSGKVTSGPNQFAKALGGPCGY